MKWCFFTNPLISPKDSSKLYAHQQSEEFFQYCSSDHNLCYSCMFQEADSPNTVSAVRGPGLAFTVEGSGYEPHRQSINANQPVDTGQRPGLPAGIRESNQLKTRTRSACKPTHKPGKLRSTCRNTCVHMYLYTCIYVYVYRHVHPR